jgi:hypothetical protein
MPAKAAVQLSAEMNSKGAPYALNVSVSTAGAFQESVGKLAPKLLDLRGRIQHAFEIAAEAW